MPVLYPELEQDSTHVEHVHFPWAHVEDFRHFFGLDKILDYSKKRRSQAAKRFALLLTLRSTQTTVQMSLQQFCARTIAALQVVETNFRIRGTLASFHNLDDAIRVSHPEIAAAERRRILQEYLVRNAVMPRAETNPQIREQRLVGILMHHASDFWQNEHEDLFDMISLLETPLQVRLVASALLHAMPAAGPTPERADALYSDFADWLGELHRTIQEHITLQAESPEGIARRATLHKMRGHIVSMLQA